MYVALSRVSKLEGLFIDNEFYIPNYNQQDEAVLALKEKKINLPLQFTMEYPQDFKTDQNILILFHNVRSLNKHLIDIQSDRSFQSADIIILVETWTIGTDDLTLETFDSVNRKDCSRLSTNRDRKHFGSIIFSKPSIKNRIITFYEFWAEEKIDINGILINNEAIIYLYKNPKTNNERFLHELEKAIEAAQLLIPTVSNIIVVGDFNINIMNQNECSTNRLQELMNKHKFIHSTPINTLSTDKSQIDLCLSLRKISAKYYDSVTSDHKIIWFLIDDKQ